MKNSSSENKAKITVIDMTVFSMLGALMYASKVLMDLLPNIHLIGVFIVAETIVYRQKALYPLYVFVFLTGLFNGFNLWWLPYLYIWTVLWGAAMLIPKEAEGKRLMIYTMIVCSLHGFLYGTIYAPAQALLFHLDFKGMISWIIAGLPYDIMHGVGNLVCGILIVPLVSLLRKADKLYR